MDFVVFLSFAVLCLIELLHESLRLLCSGHRETHLPVSATVDLRGVMRVLIVDDQPINGRLALVMLGKAGVPCAFAASGEEALLMAEQAGDFSHVLLDISMPGMNGRDVCQALRRRPSGERLHIVAYTAHAFADEAAQIMAAGFDALLIKPIRREGLLKALHLWPGQCQT